VGEGASENADLDAVIVGGGIAGLWLLNLLHARGHDAVLLEAEALGCQQTLGSQGMIHGGLKYALGGSLTGASEAIAGMPDAWRACLAGEGDVDLTGLAPLSERYYLFAEGSSLGRLTTFFASRALRGRIRRLKRHDFPAALAPFGGVVYELNDFVLDTRALMSRLLDPVAGRVHRHRLQPGELTPTDGGWLFRPASIGGSFRARRLLLCAGAGNGALLEGLGISRPVMQLRPLKQVVVQKAGLTALYAHCLTGIGRPEPRLTITSHPDPERPGGWLWYLGGQIATDGVSRTDAAQIRHARAELAACVPWIDWRDARIHCLPWDRAEPGQTDGRRPDEAYVTEAAEGLLVCWPTKLTLAPDLGRRVLERLDPPAGGQAARSLGLPLAQMSPLPWVSL
jgi:glycine/D-amino acid oxidase-like deaminating enzyme